MDGVTYRQVAEAIGASKPYVIKLCRQLDPTGEHTDTEGATHRVDAWLASAIASEAERRRRTPRGGSGDAVEAVTEAQAVVRGELEAVWAARLEDAERNHAATVAALEGHVGSLERQLEDMRRRLDDEREAHKATRARLERSESIAAEALACRWPWQIARVRRRLELPGASQGE